jgi:hypothetical protein
MQNDTLTAFWIQPPGPSGPFGYGVTAFSVTDAIEIVRRAGFRLPDDLPTAQIRTHITPTDIEHEYVRQHMGPIMRRGLWYPFIDAGFGT